MITSKALAKKFATKYTLPVRTFGLTKSHIGKSNWIFRRLITNVLVGGSNEDNAINAAEEIFANYSDCYGLAQANNFHIGKILNENQIRFSKRKANNVISVANIISHSEGEVPSDRNSLEALPGVGRHTASIVQALAFDIPAFGVDLHVRRIAKRLGLVSEKANDLSIENILMEGVAKKDLAAYSRAFVDFGKEVCAKDPDCANCFLRTKCPTSLGTVVVTAKKSAIKITSGAKVADGRYGVVAGSSEKEYFVTVSGAKISCNCKGYRFKKTCSHVKEIAA